MEAYINQAVDFISSADIYLLAIAGVLTALLPIIRKTKTKTDDKIADKVLGIIGKVRNYFPSGKTVLPNKKTSTAEVTKPKKTVEDKVFVEIKND